MAKAQGSQFQTCYVKEDNWGTTPTTPTMIKLPVSENTLALSKSTLEDNTLRGDRMRSDVRHGMRTIGGALKFGLKYGDFDALLAGALFGEWTTDVLKAGIKESYFTVEKGFTDIGQYIPYRGLMVNTLSMSIKADAIVDCTMEFVGKDITVPSATPLNATPTDYSTNQPFDSFTGTLSEGGSGIAIVTGLDLTVDNGLEGLKIVGSNSIAGVVSGRSKVSGTMTAYFENLTLLNKFINETSSAIICTLEDIDGNEIEINIPNVKYMGGDPGVSGEGAIELSLPFEGLYDATTDTCIQLTRITA